MPADSSAGDVVRELIETEIAECTARNDSLEKRGLAIVTTAGALISLFSTAVTLALRGTGVTYSLPMSLFSAVAMICLLSAGVSGIWVNRPRHLKAAAIGGAGGIESMLEPEQFRAEATAADRRIAEVRVKYLKSLRYVNIAKGRALVLGLWLEVAGVAFLAIAAGSAGLIR